MGPQEFDLQVSETYATKDPAAPIEGTQIQGTVTVTLNWNATNTELTGKGVEFSDTLWLGTGKGPLTVYDDALGGLRPVGTVEWKTQTHAIQVQETDTPNKQVRWAITPVVQLIRTLCSSTGAPPDTEIAYTASDTVRGNWMPQPSS